MKYKGNNNSEILDNFESTQGTPETTFWASNSGLNSIIIFFFFLLTMIFFLDHKEENLSDFQISTLKNKDDMSFLLEWSRNAALSNKYFRKIKPKLLREQNSLFCLNFRVIGPLGSTHLATTPNPLLLAQHFIYWVPFWIREWLPGRVPSARRKNIICICFKQK